MCDACEKLNGSLPSTWRNYGDANPRVHGGRFLKHKDLDSSAGCKFTLLVTTDLETQGPSGMIQDDERYMIEEYTIYPDDVWEDGDPEKGWSEAMKGRIDTLQGGFDPKNPEDVMYLVPELQFVLRTAPENYTSNYWGYLRNYGIYKETVT